MHWMFADLSDVAQGMISIIPHGVWVETSLSPGRDVIGCGQSKSTGKILREKMLYSRLQEPVPGYWPAITHHWIRLTQKTTLTCRDRQMNDNCTKWPRSTSSEDVAGQPKPTRYTEEISRSKLANDSGRIHFRNQRKCQRILVTLSTWLWGCL